MQWYYAINGQRSGPVSESEFEKLVRDGAIQPSTLVWHEGMAEWQPYSKVAGATAQAASSTGAAAGTGDDTEVCAVSGKRYPRREMIQYEGKWVSAEHRDEFFQRIREGLGQAGQMKYAGFWIRFAAKFIDGLIQAAVGVLVNLGIAIAMLGTANYFVPSPDMEPARMLAFQVVSQIAGFAVGIGYACFFIRKYQATPGKMIVGLRLIRADGSPLSIGRIIGRYFAELLSGLLLGIGYIMAAFDEERRALHDRICDTRVIVVDKSK